MANANFRFHDELERFLATAHRGRLIARDCARAATLKNAVEALGVPHTEVGRLSVNGAPATLARSVRSRLRTPETDMPTSAATSSRVSRST